MTDPPVRPSILSELKRRQVYRVGAMYGAVSFVIWQAADIAVPALGLPDTAMRLVVITAIVGFPVALILAWIYEWTPEGIRTTNAVDAEIGTERPPIPGARRAAWRRVAVASLVLVVLLGSGWWVAGRQLLSPAADPDDRSVAVFPFAVRGSDTLDYLREGLMDMVSRNLAGAADLRPLDPSLVLRLGGGTDPDPAEAAVLARRAGALRFVLGSVTRAGGQLRIDAALYQPGDSVRPPAIRTVQGDSMQLFDLVDRLTAELLAEQRTGAASERLVRTAAMTTASLDALKSYLRGEQRFRTGEHADAVDEFRNALVHDSTFALARYRLALAQHMRGGHDVAHRESRRALEYAARLTDHERRVIDAFHAYHDGRVEEAQRRLEESIREQPRDLEARLILAELLMQYAPLRGGPLTEAKRHLDAVIEADPKFACIHCQLVVVEFAEGDLDAAERWLRLSGGRTGDTSRIADPADRFAIAVRRGDAAGMRSALTAHDTLPRDRYGSIIVGQFGELAIMAGDFAMVDTIDDAGRRHGVEAADLELLALRRHLARGEWQQADASAARYARLRGSGPTLMARAILLLFRAPLELRLAAHDTLRRELEALPTAANEDPDANSFQRMLPAFRHFALGLTSSRLGDDDAARHHADALEGFAATRPTDRTVSSAMAATVRADVAFRAGEPEAALDLLGSVGSDIAPTMLLVPLNAASYAAGLRAAAYAATARPELALRWLRHGVTFYGQPHSPQVGTWHRDMGRVLDELGRTDEARQHHARFLAAWPDADPALQPQVAAARRRVQEPESTRR
jgi:tetratricopeptide (TPR) repeat protein